MAVAMVTVWHGDMDTGQSLPSPQVPHAACSSEFLQTMCGSLRGCGLDNLLIFPHQV